MTKPRILSIQVGRPKTYGAVGAADPMDRLWETSFFKEAVEGPLWLGPENLEGNGQADLRSHGGPDKAVLSYAASHYPDWRVELGKPDFPFGAFAENFTIEGLSEATVCIGDTYAVGDARIQVSQSRGPCWKIARRWRIEGLTERVLKSGRPGWYCRVLHEGEVAPGMTLELLERPHPEWTITRVHTTVYGGERDPDVLAALAAVPELADKPRGHLELRLAKVVAAD